MNQLKSKRVKMGWSQQRLADESGVGQTTISAIERGAMIPTIEIAIKIARAMKCSIDELFIKEAAQ